MQFPSSQPKMIIVRLYVALKPPKGPQKRSTAVFYVNSHFAWRKSATKSTMRFPMSRRWTSHVPWPTKGWLKTQSVQNLNN